MNKKIYKSYINKYWISWIIFCSILILIKLLNIPILNKIEIHIFYFIYWIFIMFLNIFESRRLMNYLKEYHHSKWEEITYLPFFGTGNVNSFRSLPFLYSSDNLNDENVEFLKFNYRRYIKFMVTVLIFFPILSILGAEIH